MRSTHASQLTHLLGAGDYICPASIQLLPQLPNLQHLDISPGKFNIVLTPPMLQPIGQLTKLQHLQLGNHLACYDTCALAASLPALKSLVFSYVDDYAVEPHDLAPLTYSRSLQVGCCSMHRKRTRARDPGVAGKALTMRTHHWPVGWPCEPINICCPFL